MTEPGRQGGGHPLDGLALVPLGDDAGLCVDGVWVVPARSPGTPLVTHDGGGRTG